jgi:glycosyltransferase involved in cell wall biosynthesis
MNYKTFISCNILRVSTFPTIEKPGMGLHPSKLCGINGYYTYYLTPYEKSKRLFKPKNTILIQKIFLLEARPRNANFVKKIIFGGKRLFSLLIFSLEGVKIVLQKNINIVHIHSPMYILIGLVGYFAKKDIYITFHGTDYHRINKAKWYKVFSFIFRKVFIISPDMFTGLAMIHGHEKIKLVQNGIDLDIYKNHNYSRDKQVVAVGSLKEEKGFEYLIEAFSMLLNKYPEYKEYKLVIAGNGLLKDSLLKRIKDLNMTKKIFLIGHKSREELIEIYNKSELFVLSSISEGFPKVILEAMACGCKIVSTDVGAVKSILEDTHYKVVKPMNSNALVEALCTTIKQKNGMTYDEVLMKYSWEKVREQYINEYKKDK